jgi:AraC family transcriptional regulator
MLTNALSGTTSRFDGHRSHPSQRAVLLRTTRRSGQESKPPSARPPQFESPVEIAPRIVDIAPANRVKRRIASWSGMTADIVQATSSERIDYCYCGPRHMLVLFDQRVRREGETSVEGLPTSSLRDLSRKLIFVPAGRHYRDWQGSRSAARMVFFYFDPEPMPPLDSPSTGADRLLAPRLCFEDAQLLSTALKLTALIEGSDSDNRSYLEALGRVLAHELARNHKGNTPMKHTIRGGLAAWQQRVVTTYIEEHLAEPIALATLAELAGLSPYHFCRAFKQSFGLPPHRYHTSRRIECAKALLAKPALSVTEIGMTVGFSETSSFSAAFRKATGLTPSAYHRGLA